MLANLFPPTRPVEESDFVAAQTPFNLLLRLSAGLFTPILKQMDQDMHDGLRKRGFMIGWGEEQGRGEIGHLGLIYLRGGGYRESWSLGEYLFRWNANIDHFSCRCWL